MTQPLALLLYEKLLPGSQLVNRLEDLGYRVQTVANSSTLADDAEREKPLCILVDLLPQFQNVCEAIQQLKARPATAHIPVIAFAADDDKSLHEIASRAGANLIVSDAAISLHLKQLLNQALTEF